MKSLIQAIANRIRPEFFSPLMVVFASIMFFSAFAGISFLFQIFGNELNIDYEFLGFLFSSIGVGELSRTFWKLKIPLPFRNNIYWSSAFAGSFCVGTLSILAMFKQSYSFWSIPLGFILGAAFYLLLIKAAQFDAR
ncbi:MAG: hypothetical protein ABJH06_06275 [Paraglaciecola sp.]|uniref:hypothetical protein n=1 Tax=Paraglaciecola sp. TaxID=1920173 RepID=UPI0032635736